MERLTPPHSQTLQRRLRRFSALILLLLGVLLLRLWYLQVVQGDYYRELSEHNRTRVEFIKPLRGLIYDRNGIPLVRNVPSFDIAVVPEDLPRDGKVLERLSRLLDVPLEEMQARIRQARHRRPFEPVKIKENADWKEVAQVEARRMDLPGVRVEVEALRHYPYGRLAAHVLGYVGKITQAQLQSPVYAALPRESLVGQYGVEKVYDQLLMGRPGKKIIEVNALGREIRVLGKQDPVPGKDLYLTLDFPLQKTAEAALGDRAGAVVALDPKTGEILALASHPAFDPNWFPRGISPQQWQRLSGDPSAPFTNRAIQAQYPPGSVFKLVVAAAGLETGEIQPHHRILCTGALRFGNRNFRCWLEGGHGWVNLYRALVESCDVYFYELGRRLGVDTIAEYAHRLGLGSPTRIPLAPEKHGLIPTRAWKERVKGEPWYPGETLSVAIGQGYVLVTPIQLAALAAALGNPGHRHPLRIVMEPPDARAPSVDPDDEPGNPVPLQAQTLAFLRRALRGVVKDPRGTGWAARSPVVEIGGKTGTAQVVALRDRRDRTLPRHQRDHAWFIALAPVEQPRIAVAVLVEHGGHGGTAAAPIARKLIEQDRARWAEPSGAPPSATQDPRGKA